MSTISQEHAGNCLFVTPVSGIYLGKDTEGEYRIDKVRLFHADKFLRLKRYHIPYKDWRKDVRIYLSKGQYKVVAVIPVSGTPDEVQRLGHNHVRDELNILSSSRVGHSNRTRPSIIGVAGCMDNYKSDYLLLSTSKDLIVTGWSKRNTDELRITREWLTIPKIFAPFRKHIRIIRGDLPVQDDWRQVLKDVAIIAGKSQNSIELSDAFLWNMIALELLLIRSDETYGHQNILLKRCKSLFGYCPLWEKSNLEKVLIGLYKARCKLVHEGARRRISLNLVINSDHILSNVLGAIVFNIKYFTTKEDLVKHSESAAARALLGMNPRPKGWHWHYTHFNYNLDDLNKYWIIS